MSSLQPHSYVAAIPILPQETFELIIDELSNSAETLASCSLVRRSWLPRSRHHLFRHIALNVIDQDALDTGLGMSRLATNKHMPRCVSANEFTTSFSNPNIVACVRGLSLNITYPQSPPVTRTTGKQGNDPTEPSIPHTIPFTQLRFLSICCGDIEIVDTKDFRLKRLMSIIRCNPYIEHVSLNSVQIDSGPWQMLLSCVAVRAKMLKTLVVNGIGDVHWRSGWVDGRIGQDPESRTTNHLNSLNGRKQPVVERMCIASCSPNKIGYVARQFDLSQMRSLALLDIDTRSCIKILKGCSEALWHLTLDFSSTSAREYTQSGVSESLSKVSVLQLLLSKIEDLEQLLQFLSLASSCTICRVVRLYLDFEESPSLMSSQNTSPQTALSRFLQLVPSVQKVIISVGAMGLESSRRLYKGRSERLSMHDVFPALIGEGIVEMGQPEQWWKESI
ncbi:hypothetical protein VKT23_011718 [Stygiomarasmius scandens]|uniref:F-box domain-containing protein n=1 Tax=Marasmiellus scandens TaxID=2682957 RepID=A0ABR1J7V9_9AGAR